MLRVSIFLVASALGASAQSLYDAMSKIPELSNFTAFYANNKAFADSYFGNTSAYPITFLAPNNKAFQDLQANYGNSLASIPSTKLLEMVQYHTLVSNVTTSDFSNSGKAGLTVPTMLNNGGENNNRTAGVALASRFGGSAKAAGQVVFIKADSGAAGRFRLMSRADGQPGSTVRSGLSSNVNIRALDGSEGQWAGGRFHVVDGILTPPTQCTATIRGAGLSRLDNALNRTQLWDALDGTPNITCLGPNNAAFGQAADADDKLNVTTLTGALLYHTLPEVAYSDYLYDGQEFKSLQNGTVRVRVTGSGNDRTIYFNNAKVIDANVLTHNGLVHVLDAVMMPLEQMNTTATTSGKPSSSASASASPSATKTGSSSAAGLSVVMASKWTWASWGLVGSLVLSA